MVVKVVILDFHGVMSFDFPKREFVDMVLNLIDRKGDEGLRQSIKEMVVSKAMTKRHGVTTSYILKGMGLLDDYMMEMKKLPRNDRIVFPDLFRQLAQKYRVYIVTDSPKDVVINSLKNNNIDVSEVCVDVITPENDKVPKPSPFMYAKVIEREGVRPDEVVVIGDRLSDIVPAEDIGCNAVLVKSEEMVGVVLNWLLSQ